MSTFEIFDGFNERLEIALKNAGYSKEDAKKKLKLSQNIFTNYANGTKPNAKNLYQFSCLLGVSMEWLLTGEVELIGETIIKDRLTEEEEQLIYTYRKLNEKQKWLLEGYLNGMMDAEKEIPDSELE